MKHKKCIIVCFYSDDDFYTMLKVVPNFITFLALVSVCFVCTTLITIIEFYMSVKQVKGFASYKPRFKPPVST